MSNITISREFVTELRGVIEDAVEYTINEYAKEGQLVSGQTAWRLIEALAITKEAEFEGMFND